MALFVAMVINYGWVGKGALLKLKEEDQEICSKAQCTRIGDGKTDPTFIYLLILFIF